MRLAPFELFAQSIRLPRSRRTVLASLGVSMVAFRSGREVAEAQTCVPNPTCGPQQRCEGVHCATCYSERYYTRFLDCVRGGCGGKPTQCCAYCAEWALACDCCSG